jgi:hypothetical protein
MKLLFSKELVKMDVEFLIDDFGFIIIMEATNIWIREKNELPKDPE